MDGLPFRLTAAPRAKRQGKKFVLKTASPNERAQQIDCTNMLRRVLLPEVCFTAIDHSHSRNPTIGRNGDQIGWGEVARRKAQGVRGGIPDYLMWHASFAYAIEFKIDDGELSEDQKVFMKELIAAGVICKVCWGAVQVMNTVYEWRLCRPQVKWEVV